MSEEGAGLGMPVLADSMLREREGGVSVVWLLSCVPACPSRVGNSAQGWSCRPRVGMAAMTAGMAAMPTKYPPLTRGKRRHEKGVTNSLWRSLQSERSSQGCQV